MMSSVFAPSWKWWPSVLTPAMQHHPLLVSHCHMQITSPSVSLGVCVCVCVCTPLGIILCVCVYAEKGPCLQWISRFFYSGCPSLFESVCCRWLITPSVCPAECSLQHADFNSLHTWNKLLFGCCNGLLKIVFSEAHYYRFWMKC